METPKKLYNLALKYRNGDGVARDEDLALKYLTEAAEKGYAPAQYSLGNYYYNRRNYHRNDLELAFKWYLLAANQGHAKALFNVGIYYEKGFIFEVDYAKSYEYLSKAANQGDEKAKELIDYTLRWVDVPEWHIDELLAIQDDISWFRVSKKTDKLEVAILKVKSIYAKNNLSWPEVQVELESKLKDVLLDIEHDKNTYLNVSHCYANCHPEIAYPVTVIGMHICMVAKLEDIKDEKDLQVVSNALYKYTVYPHNEDVENREWVWKEEIDYIIEYYKVLDEMGYARAKTFLGQCYEEGMGFEKNKEKALQLYEQAAALGDAEGIYEAAMHRVIDKKAMEMLEQSAKLGCVNAQYFLALYTEDGIECEPDLEKAIYWYKKAADAGHYYAKKEMDDFYELGIVEKEED